MSENDNRQWFEQGEELRQRRQSRTGGKKPSTGAPKNPVDPSRKKRNAKRGSAPSGNPPPRPDQKKKTSPAIPPKESGNRAVPPKQHPGGKSDRPHRNNASKTAPGPSARRGSSPKAAPDKSVNKNPKNNPGREPESRPRPEKGASSPKPIPQPAIPLKGEPEPRQMPVTQTPNEIRKKSSRRKALMNAGISIALVLAGILVLLFVVHHLFDYFAVKPNLEFVTNGSIEHTIGSRAIIVRNENVVASNHGGDFVTQAAEGSRVAAGQSIAMVVPSDMQTVVDNLRNTQTQISDAQQELIADGLAEGADVIYNDIDQSLNPIINMLRIDSIEGNLSEMSSYASSISVLLNQRELELADLDFDDERLRVLRSDERGYESQLQNRASVINAPEPGIISFKLDGLETVLNYEVLLNADAGTIADYIDNAAGIITSDLVVEAGDNVARIASNQDQYIACFLNESDAPSAAFEVGSQHTVIVGSEGLSIGKCIVQRIQPTSNGNYLVVFSTTRYVEDLLDVRSADIEVVITETRGLRVPVSSLVDPDYSRGVATLYINDQGFCSELGVLIVDYDREFAIVTPMGDGSAPNLQTVYITNPDSVSPGDQVS